MGPRPSFGGGGGGGGRMMPVRGDMAPNLPPMEGTEFGDSRRRPFRGAGGTSGGPGAGRGRGGGQGAPKPPRRVEKKRGGRRNDFGDDEEF